ncbi:hypothetical protein DL95DRAFT_387860, partial [Leptodontidium sp. 2 PMI_412]
MHLCLVSLSLNFVVVHLTHFTPSGYCLSACVLQVPITTYVFPSQPFACIAVFIHSMLASKVTLDFSFPIA